MTFLALVCDALRHLLRKIWFAIAIVSRNEIAIATERETVMN